MVFMSQFLVFVCDTIILGFFIRYLAAKYPDSIVGKFGAFIY